MTKITSCVLAIFIPAAMWAQVQTQTIVLTDGSEITGTVVGAGPRYITVRDSNRQLRRFTFDQLQFINFNDYNAGPGSDSGARGGTYRDQPYQQAPANNYDAGYMVIPSGSEIVVRTNEAIDSGISGQDRAYYAQVDHDVVDASGNVMVPRGSDARLIVRNIGNNRIALDLQSVTVNGRSYVVNSDDVTRAGRQGVGENRRTGEFVGGGAVLGTLLGAIAGGGKGAAIGALAGGAAGVGAEVLTKGDRVKVPAETVLTFRLDSALNLNTTQQRR